MRQQYDEAIDFWKPIWDLGDGDMRALSYEGDWDPDARRDRKEGKRPITHTDIISQFNNRLVNQARMRKRGFSFVSTGPTATDESAALREGRARQIQYEAKSFSAAITALQNSVDRGIGHWKVSTERINPRSFDQRITVDRIPNVKSVVIDPKTRKADRSDMRFAWHIDKVYTEDEFKAEFPEAKIQSFDPQHRLAASKWIGQNYILVAQYYRVIKTKDRLLRLTIAGQMIDILKSELPEDFDLKAVEPLRDEEVEIPRVEIRLTNGVEWLGAPTPWPGSTIPIITVVGREKYTDNKLEIESLTRKMREPQREYDFANSAEVEDVGMSPKPKWLTVLGQTDGLDEWQEANRSNFPELRWRPIVEGIEAPQPKRIDSSVDMTKYEVVKNSALRAAQNAVGMTTADAKDRQSKSGVAQDKLDESADINGFHFTDNWDEGWEYFGRIVNEILDKIEDNQRTVGLRDKADNFSTKQLDVQQGPDGEVTNHPYGAAEDHGVTVEVGPDSSSQREEAKDFLMKFADSLKGTPEYPRVAYLILQFMNLGPVMDEAVDNLMPQDIRQAKDAKKKGQAPTPPQVRAQLQAMQQHVQQMQQLLKEQAQIIDGKVIETNGRKEIEIKKAEFQKIVQIAQIEMDKYAAELKYKADLAKVNATANAEAAALLSNQEVVAAGHALDFDKAQLQHGQAKELTGIQQEHEIGMTGLNQEHEVGMAGINQSHEAAMAEQAAKNQPEVGA